MPTVFEDEELRGPLQWRSILQHGIAAIAYYLLAFFHLVLAFLKKQPHRSVGHHPMISNPGTATALNREDPSVAMPSISEDGNKGTICSKGFMPNLQVLHVTVRGRAIQDHRYRNNLGWEYLSSLYGWDYYDYREDDKVEAVLRRAAQVHPNRPTLRIER
jgi:hypothetical protein